MINRFLLLFRLNHPVKKFKPDSRENLQQQRLNKLAKMDIYTLYNQHNNNITTNNNNETKLGTLTMLKSEIKQEPGLNVSWESS